MFGVCVVIALLGTNAAISSVEFNIYFVMIDGLDESYAKEAERFSSMFTDPIFHVHKFDIQGKLYSPTLFKEVNDLKRRTGNLTLGAIMSRYEPILAALFADVPYFIISYGPQKSCDQLNPNHYSVLPSMDVIAQTIATMLCSKTAVSAAVIGDRALELTEFLKHSETSMSGIHALAKHSYHSVFIDHHVSAEALKDLLKEVRDLGYHRIVLHSSNEQNIHRILNASYSLDMLTHVYTWYLTYLNTKNLPMKIQNLLEKSYANFRGLNIINAEFASGNNINDRINISSFAAGKFVIHATILDSISAMSSVLTRIKGIGFQKVGFYSYMDFMLHFDQWKTAEDFKNTVGWITTPAAMGPTQSRSFCRAVHLTIYGTIYGHKFLKIATASSTEYKGFITVNTTAEAQRIEPVAKMSLFSRDPIRVVTRADPPFIFTYRDKNNVTRINETYGMLKDYMDAYAKYLGFKYKFYLVADGEMGHYHPDKGWNGMVDEIIDGRADIAGGAFSIDVNRSRVIDYTEATIPWTLSLLMRAPIVERTIWQFLKPFDMYLWLLILGVLFVMSFLLTLLTWIDYTTDTINLSDSFYHIAAILTQGSSETNPTSIPSRIMIAFVMFFAIVFNASYTANMTAFLTLRNEDASIKTLEVLSTQGKVKFGVVDGSEAMNLLKKMTTNPALLLWSTISRERDQRILPSYEAAVIRIKQGDFILISESLISSYYVNIDCELVAVSQPSFTIRYALGLPLGLPVKRKLDEAITKVREDDMDSKIKAKYYRSNSVCTDRSSSSQTKIETKPLTAKEMVGVFVALVIGAGLSIVAAVIGHFTVVARKRYAEKKESQNKGQLSPGVSIMQNRGFEGFGERQSTLF